jgi:hypothetical protein
MLTLRRERRRLRPYVEAIEPRDPPAGLELAGLAAAIGSSPVVAAARTAALAYHAGQLAYTGHTSLLLGTVRISQPFALRNLGAGQRSRVGTASIRHTLPSTPLALAGEREGGPDRHGHAAIHKHSRGHGHHKGNHHHHQRWDHDSSKHEGERGHGGNHGD